MLPWQLFASSLSQVSNSLVGNSNLVAKVYFPRLVLPLSAVGVSLVDFVITLAAMFGLMAFFGVVPTWRILALPFFLAVAVIAALGAGLWLGALCVRYRDVRHITPFSCSLGSSFRRLLTAPKWFWPKSQAMSFCTNSIRW